MCIERAYLVAVLTKVMEQDIAILIFVKIFQLELQFFSLTTSLAITGIPRNFNTVNSLPEGGGRPKTWASSRQSATGLPVADSKG